MSALHWYEGALAHTSMQNCINSTTMEYFWALKVGLRSYQRVIRTIKRVAFRFVRIIDHVSTNIFYAHFEIAIEIVDRNSKIQKNFVNFAWGGFWLFWKRANALKGEMEKHLPNKFWHDKRSIHWWICALPEAQMWKMLKSILWAWRENCLFFWDVWFTSQCIHC